MEPRSVFGCQGFLRLLLLLPMVTMARVEQDAPFQSVVSKDAVNLT